MLISHSLFHATNVHMREEVTGTLVTDWFIVTNLRRKISCIQSYAFRYFKIPSPVTCSSVTDSYAIVVKQIQHVKHARSKYVSQEFSFVFYCLNYQL